MQAVLADVRDADAWRTELRAFVRAISGACLFGVPLLYTMEMWWLGEISRPGHTLLALGVTLGATFALVSVAGAHRGSWSGKVAHTLLAVAVGAIVATVVLLVLHRLTSEHAPSAILGKIVAQVLPLSIGAALADIIFHGDRDGDDETPSSGFWAALVNDVGATAIGAVFIAASIAPTEEVPMLAARMDALHLLGLIGLSLVAGYLTVFASGFDPAAKRDRGHLFQHPATETALAYLISLIVSFGVLLLSHQVGEGDPAGFVLAQTLVLGLPAMIGGAAGRIAI
ncbi:MAG: TIGR02587 family membrane protein [Chloroflexota bacterium]